MALLLAVLVALVTVWAVIIGAVCVAVAMRMVGRRAERIEVQRRRLAELAARADEQNRLMMQGDERGVYGEFPPAAA
jgi:predicted membrane-bound spermidine synthase